jgi:hypothetical protein
METIELRIGNLIYFNNDVVDITGIGKLGVSFGKHGFCQSLSPEWFKPILLTEDWLLKFGFVKDEFVAGFELSFGRQSFIVAHAQDNDLLLLYQSDIGCNYNDLCFVETVHSLQNIIYSLTGEELEVK